jgi:hypothetical protein
MTVGFSAAGNFKKVCQELQRFAGQLGNITIIKVILAKER